jgi:hypothetical protein
MLDIELQVAGSTPVSLLFDTSLVVEYEKHNHDKKVIKELVLFKHKLGLTGKAKSSKAT